MAHDFNIQDLKDGGFWTAVGIVATGLAEYFINHPITALSAAIMLLVAWNKHLHRRFLLKNAKEKAEQEAKEHRLKAEREEIEIEYQRERLKALLKERGEDVQAKTGE